ncbi:beta-galactosidase [Maricaulis sp.]|uniref:beta-galactosidase n=1 Tax=Maricaulis sp. TaxID=1486257 RepID=UPI002633A934|nr:beta-galactosidase [Maricaulis sp.]
MRLGVCYYPEHWPKQRWAIDAEQMAKLGISHVRLGEFAWARFEPEPGQYDWAWFDEAIEVLHAAGLKLILGTPTATPPKWLVDQDPSMLAVDAEGRTRGFGSRRHYCFSSASYRAECRRIVTAMAQRYGEHPAVVMWQTDNEYGCHDTVESYSQNARAAFRVWLKARYGDVTALNTAWGNVFWSMEYRSFDEVDPPVGTVTEPNPSHVVDYQRFCSDQVASFNAEQVEILRRLSPGREITHNFMGAFTAFDHHKVGADMDLATWDSYPLGFLDMSPFPDAMKQRYLRQGHPDFQAFHHDLYRGCSSRWGVMEQQPGPVNWAPNNPAPLDGMVRLWSLEAFAHGADLVSWFRWRQCPYAQEQMHAGLLRVDAEPAPAFAEAGQVARDLKQIAGALPQQAPVALLWSYDGQWIHHAQPQGEGLDLLRQTYETYTVLRRLGLDIDIVPPQADLDGYRLIILPGLPHLSETLMASLSASSAQIIALCRTGSKTQSFQIPANLAPGPMQALLALKVTRVESLREGIVEAVELHGEQRGVERWREAVETDLPVQARYRDGAPFWVRDGHLSYLAGWPQPELLGHIIATLALEAGMEIALTHEDVRLRTLGNLRFAFNYGPEPVSLAGMAPDGADFVLGSAELAPAGVAAWRL